MTAGNVHWLPDPMLRQWEVHARAVREGMQAVGYSQDEIAHALAVMRPLYLRYARSWTHPLSDDPDAVVAALSAWVSGVFNPLLVRIAQLEVELLQAGLREPQSPAGNAHGT